MGIYGISIKEFLEGHLNNDGNRYSFEDFLRDFEGDVSAEIVAEAWNKLANKHKWNDKLKVI